MKIDISPYNPAWPIIFEEAKKSLMDTLRGHVTSIQHIGSTAIPGLAAKPVIDILIAVASLAEADEFCIQPVIGLGYEYVSEFEAETPQRRFFRKVDAAGTPTHHIHMVVINSDWWVDHLLFRDYLRGNREARLAYERLKHQLSEREWDTRDDYTQAKTEFIQQTLQAARTWRQGICL